MIRAVNQHFQKTQQLVKANVNSLTAPIINVNRHGHQHIRNLSTTMNEGINTPNTPKQKYSSNQTNFNVLQCPAMYHLHHSNEMNLNPTSFFGNAKKETVKGFNTLISHSQRMMVTRTFHSSNRNLSSALSPDEVKKGMQSLTDQFMEARELLEDARESIGTTYFSEDMLEAQAAVKDTLAEYKELLSKLSDKQREDVVRTIGLRMEELKAQEQALEETLNDH